MRQTLRLSFLPLLATLLWLLQALLPFFALYQTPRHPAASPPALAALFGDTVLVCTADGFRFVSWKDIQSGKTTITPHKQYQCALCYVAAHGQGLHAAPPSAQAPAILIGARLHPPIASHSPRAREQLWQQRLTRSPPHTFV